MNSIVLVTCPIESAEKISKTVLQERLAACVNIIRDVRSLFWWEGKIDTAEESLLIIKTRTELVTKLEDSIKRVHPYEVPEIIALPITQGNKKYLDWVNQETASDNH